MFTWIDTVCLAVQHIYICLWKCNMHPTYTVVKPKGLKSNHYWLRSNIILLCYYQLKTSLKKHRFIHQLHADHGWHRSTHPNIPRGVLETALRSPCEAFIATFCRIFISCRLPLAKLISNTYCFLSSLALWYACNDHQYWLIKLYIMISCLKSWKLCPY